MMNCKKTSNLLCFNSNKLNFCWYQRWLACLEKLFISCKFVLILRGCVLVHAQNIFTNSQKLNLCLQEPQLLVCSFSPDGSYIVAGASSNSCYIWSWEALASRSSPPASSRGCEIAPDPPPPITSETLRKQDAPVFLHRATGHTREVILLQFSNAGDAFATGSKDGTLRVSPLPGLK